MGRRVLLGLGCLLIAGGIGVAFVALHGSGEKAVAPPLAPPPPPPPPPRARARRRSRSASSARPARRAARAPGGPRPCDGLRADGVRLAADALGRLPERRLDRRSEPRLGNRQLGWVRATPLRLLRRPVELDVDLSKRELIVRDARGLERRISVAVGAPATPTPVGRFYVTDKLRGADFGTYYGCCILALSGRQPNLPEGWSGRRPAGDPRLPHADLGPRRLERLPARGGARPPLPDEDRPARDHGADPRVDSADGRRRPRGAAHPPRRVGRLGHPLEPRARAGDRAPGEGLLGVRPARDRLRPAGRPGSRRAGRDLPLDGADPVEPARGRALGARGDRRRLPLTGDHDARAAVQPDEAEPRRRARPRPHHHGGRPRARPREPRIPAGARRADPDDGPDVQRRAERDHRREGDSLRAARDRRHRHRRAAAGGGWAVSATARSRRSSIRLARPVSG